VRIDLSHRSEYAIRATVAIALAGGGVPLSTRRIAEQMDVPAGFLAHVLADLVQAGIVSGTPGRNGGYNLTVPAAELDLLRVVDAVETDDKAPRCVMRAGSCGSNGACAVHEAFESATTAMRRKLAATKLSDVATRHQRAAGSITAASLHAAR